MPLSSENVKKVYIFNKSQWDDEIYICNEGLFSKAEKETAKHLKKELNLTISLGEICLIVEYLNNGGNLNGNG
jgi:hypothetical protein